VAPKSVPFEQRPLTNFSSAMKMLAVPENFEDDDMPPSPSPVPVPNPMRPKQQEQRPEQKKIFKNIFKFAQRKPRTSESGDDGLPSVECEDKSEKRQVSVVRRLAELIFGLERAKKRKKPTKRVHFETGFGEFIQ
jgi:hypothetical protein